MIWLRKLRLEDLALLLAWRQDREIMQFLTASPERPTWEGHLKWFRSRHDRLDWIIELSEDGLTRDVGTVHYLLDTGGIGLIVGEKTLWGKGVGKAALEQALRDPRMQAVWAQVHKKNTQSHKLFGGLGFKLVKPTGRKLAPEHEEWVLR